MMRGVLQFKWRHHHCGLRETTLEYHGVPVPACFKNMQTISLVASTFHTLSLTYAILIAVRAFSILALTYTILVAMQAFHTLFGNFDSSAPFPCPGLTYW